MSVAMEAAMIGMSDYCDGHHHHPPHGHGHGPMYPNPKHRHSNNNNQHAAGTHAQTPKVISESRCSFQQSACYQNIAIWVGRLSFCNFTCHQGLAELHMLRVGPAH